MNTQIIAIANQKGGVGKTTTCANLGIGLAQVGKKVLLIDGDPQGSLTISLGNPQPDKLPFTLSDAMGKILMDQPIRPGEGILHHAEGVDLMPADIQLSGMEVSLVNAMSRETILRQYLDTLKGQYSHILIDCQPSLGMLTVNALAAANRIIIPVQAEYLPAKGVRFLLLGAACSGTYFFISKLLPTTYSNLINATTEKAAMHLVEQMTAFDNISDCENDISNFSKETNAAFWIEDSNGRIIYPDEASMETSNTSADYTVTFDEDESFIDMQPSGATTTNFYPFTLKNGTAYTLAVQTDLFVVQQATKVLLSILPYVILMVFLLSLLCAWLYTRYITRPIVRLSKISKRMAELDFSGQCSTGREDELGCLAQNLNSLSASLSTALNDLQAANQQLKTDIEKEQELERQRVDFFSAASHELKTPLTILKGHLAGMLNGVSGYENHIEYMERSLAVVDRMEKLVKELLYLSKAEGTQKTEYKTVDFAEILRVQIATVADLLEEKKQHLEANIPTRLYCEVEQAQMERAIQNILVNAIRYSPSGELIRISLSETHGTIRGEIENTGVRVPDDAIPHLFEAFYRADTSRNRNTGGTGLGLYIVRKVMEMHRANYGISNINNGVLFWFELPCKQPVDNSI